MNILRGSTVVLALVALTGCGVLGDFGAGPGAPTMLVGAESGSRVAPTLGSTEITRLRVAARQVIDNPAANRDVTWAGRSGAVGKVSAGPLLLVDPNGGPEVSVPAGLALNVVLSPAGGNYVTQSRANVRLGPSTNNKIVTTLPAATKLRSLGQDKGANWYLVGQGDRAIGYIFGPLVKKVAGGNLALAGGRPEPMRLCRELTYQVVMPTGTTDNWTNGACRIGGGPWEVVGGAQIPSS